MTAQSPSVARDAAPITGGPFLGFGNALRKELTEWGRGKSVFVVALVAVALALFTTVIPFVVDATGIATNGPPLSRDPTVNVLQGWQNGQAFALIAILASMALLTAERDRGTLAWSLANPVSRASILAAKFVAALVVIGFASVVVPLAVSVAVATLAYGGLPDLGTVALLAALYLTVPAFYIALTIAIGTVIRSTAGVAGVALAVLFLPAIAAGLLPIVNEVSPTSIGAWAMAVASGGSASALTLAAWAASMIVFAIGAKLIFDREEF
jgi:ABC-type transport system involved in multi-copper enzyme maturation permease subunit